MTTIARGKTYNDHMLAIVQEYRDARRPWPATARQIARWAYENGRWHAPRSTAITRCAQDLSRAMREDDITDPQGRRVRAKHAATFLRGEEQLTRWEDMRSASSGHMAVAFQQRRQGIVGDCKQLRIDVDSFNQNNQEGAVIQLSLNFENDVAEALTDVNDAMDRFSEKLRSKKPR